MVIEEGKYVLRENWNRWLYTAVTRSQKQLQCWLTFVNNLDILLNVTTINYDALSSFVDVDDVDMEFHAITENEFDADYENQETIDAIFKYYRKHGARDYKFTEQEK